MRIAPGGWRLAAIPAVGGTAAFVLWHSIPAIILLLTAAAVLAFYRDPHRKPAGCGPVAPADGIVHEISNTPSGQCAIAIFLNVWDVHVIRASWADTVTACDRVSGHRHPAFLSTAAENAGVRLELTEGTITLRAGFVARRVQAYVRADDAIDRADRIGHIAFGSRVDVTLPADVSQEDLAIECGQRVRAGVTPLVSQ